MQSHKLRLLFQELNTRYFDGKVRGYSLRTVDPPRRLPSWRGECRPGRRLIKLRRGLDETLLRETLIHEMAHAVAGQHHGKRFVAEMARLRGAGAPVNPQDLEPNTDRLSKSEVRHSVEMMLGTEPKARLSRFAASFADGPGYARSGAELLRKYPWVRKVFVECRREEREYERQRAASRERMKAAAKRTKGAL